MAQQSRKVLDRAISEADWSRTVCEYAKLMGWEIISFEAPLAAIRKRTLLDLYMTHPIQKRAVWAELKREGGKPTAKQREFMEQLTRAGVEVCCWQPSNWLEVEAALR